MIRCRKGPGCRRQERENYLIRLDKEFAFAGTIIPDTITVDGQQIRLRSFVFEVMKKKGSITPEEQAKIDRTWQWYEGSAPTSSEKIGSADLTVAEAESLYMTAVGLDRAIDTLGRAHEPRSSVVEEARKAKMEDGRRWLGLVRRIYHERKTRKGRVPMNGKKRVGSCRQCGNCCRDFIIDIRIGDVTDFEFTDYLQWINCHANVQADIKNFKRRDVELLIKTPCKYLVDNGDGKFSCAIQDSKPEICRPLPGRGLQRRDQPKMRLQVRRCNGAPRLKIFIRI